MRRAARRLEFQLTVTDKEGQPDSDTMVVTVTGAEPENTPPTAAIDAAQVTTAEVGEMVALQGVGGDAETAAESLTFAWSQVGGNAAGVHRRRKRGHGQLHRPGT